ncbi:MAG: pyridoxal phosphate-dependent aminotransferase [Myxococcales bacterium]|nr:pyridoxal phosphate-dependent aminotransferase [Myxococcales bacterium]
MKLADRLSTVAPSATLAMAQKARDMKAKGRDVVSLTTGEPDFPPPDHVIEAIHKALTDGYTRYTPVGGLPELVEVIRAHYANKGLSLASNQVVVSAGAKQAVFNVAMAVLNPGDEAVVLAPYWVSYPDIIRIAEATPVTAVGTQDDGFVVRPEVLDAAMTDKTRLVILNSPSNPTGGVYSRADLEATAEVLRRYPNAVIISDEIYDRFLYEGAEQISLLEVAPDLEDRTVVVNGCSKTFAMTGLRLGWAVGPKPLIAAMNMLQGQSTSNASAPIQMGGVAALTGDPGPVERMLAAFDRRRRFIVDKLRHFKGVTCFDPRGAFYAFPDVSGLFGKARPDGTVVKDADDLSDYLLEQYAVVVVPGAPFGAPNHVRLSYATDEDTLDRALTRMAEAFERLR